MATKKKTMQKVGEAPSLPDIYFRMNSLLHTVRCIAQHEDQLCTILHEIKQSKGINADTARDLSTLVEELPSHAYAEELEAVRSALEVIEMVESPAKSSSTRSELRTNK